MFSKIVVPLDGSKLAEQMVPYAASLAESLLIPLELFHVVNPAGVQPRDGSDHGDSLYLDETNPHVGDVRALPEVTHEGYLDQIMENHESWARTYLNGFAQGLQTRDRPVKTTVTVGDPVSCIVQEAHQAGDALVAMATHGRTGLARLLMGSVADGVLHHGNMAVLLFRPRPDHVPSDNAPRTIIVPLDGWPSSEQALPAAATLGRALGAKVLLVRVASTYSLAPVPAGPGVFLPAAADGDARTYLETHVHSLCVDRVDADSIVLRGDPGMEVVKLARTTPDSMVLMTTHGRSGIPRMVLGSVAEDIVRESTSPVLILRRVE